MKNNNIIKEAQKTIYTEIDALKKLSSSLGSSFLKTINTINNIKGRVVCCGVGKSAKILNKISSTFSSVGISSFVLDVTDANHGSLGSIKKDDILLIASFSGNSSELINILKFAKRFKIKTIGISSNSKSKLISSSDIKLITPKIKEAGNKHLNFVPTSSSTMLVALGDAIAMTIAYKRKFKKENFGHFHPSGSLGKNLSPVTDIMKKGNDIPMVKENYSISKVILEISSKRLGCALVINKNKKIVGFCSDGDLRRFMKKNKNFYHKCAKDMMSKQPTTINEKSFIVDALKIMNQKKITVLIVEKNKKIKGLIHMHDIISFLGI